MVWFCRIIYILEFLAVFFTSIKIYREKKDAYKYLILISIVAMIQLVASSMQLIDLRNCDEGSLLLKICLILPSIVFICTNILLYATVLYVTRQLKFIGYFIHIALLLFLFYGIFDSLTLLLNFYYGQSFALQLLPIWNSLEAPLNYVVTSENLFFYHRMYVFALILLTFFALLLKCSTLPFVYAGKYFFLGFFIVISAIINNVYQNTSYYSVRVQYHVLFFAFLPIVLYWRFNHYRPSLMLSYIRQMVFDRLGSPVVLFDINNMLVDFNIDAEKMFLLKKSNVDSLSLAEFLSISTNNQIRSKTTSTVEEVKITLPTGINKVFKMDYSCLTDKFGKSLGTLLIFHDVTHLKELYNTMERTAMTDVLTGLASGAFLKKKITEINLYRKFPYSAVVCELNGISLIQEGFGEDVAKAAIMHVAEVVRTQLRATDFASYSDGNMIILMPDTDVILAERVFKRVAQILEKDKTFNFMLSFEYGIASRPTRDSDMQLTVAQAAASLAKNKIVKSAYVQDSIIESLQSALRSSDFETEQHSRRVQNLSVLIAKNLKLHEKQVAKLKLLALFHDIGKLSVPQEILLKKDALTDDEKQVMILHTINGFKIANCSAELSIVAREILCHHENWDGTGYPNGYKGEAVPYLARIVSVADSFDVMTHDRAYAKAVSVEEAKDSILMMSGTKFDPKVVKAFDEIPIKELKKML